MQILLAVEILPSISNMVSKTLTSDFAGTSNSQLELVQMRESYDCDVDGCPASYDGIHPNALGEKNFEHVALTYNFYIEEYFLQEKQTHFRPR
jgi:hypothetical protein